MCVCVCVCACVRARARNRGGDRDKLKDKDKERGGEVPSKNFSEIHFPHKFIGPGHTLRLVWIDAVMYNLVRMSTRKHTCVSILHQTQLFGARWES